MALAPVFSPPGPLDLDEWLSLLTEEALDPDLPIIDCHHHLWDTPGAGRPGSAPPRERMGCRHCRKWCGEAHVGKAASATWLRISSRT